MSGAAVASVFGVAGTVVGAAVVSVIATVAGALYSHGLRQTGEKLQQSPVVRQWWQPRRPMAAPLSGTDDNSATATATALDGRPSWRERLSDRRWGVAVATGGVFVLSLLLITAVELVGQRPISGSHDRDTTSIGSLLGGSGSTDEAPADDPSTDDPSAPDATTDDDGSADDEDGTGGDGPATTDGSDAEAPPDTEEPPDGTTPPTSEPASPPTSASSGEEAVSAP